MLSSSLDPRSGECLAKERQKPHQKQSGAECKFNFDEPTEIRLTNIVRDEVKQIRFGPKEITRMNLSRVEKDQISDDASARQETLKSNKLFEERKRGSFVNFRRVINRRACIVDS